MFQKFIACCNLCLLLVRAGQVKVGWAQRKKNRMAKHVANLLSVTKQQLENELSSCAARCASPVLGDDAVAEQDSPECLVHQDTPESPLIHDALIGMKRRFVTVQ